MGKTISTYTYKVKKHILDDKSPNQKTCLSIMVCENKIIGGYSNPDYEGADFSLVPAGGIYSLEGKNFEDIKNINYNAWRNDFIKKCQ
ncbi:DUF4830 domain-containing protein [Acetivibrio clariflavus]|uniref:DUF4830 domain-containing protein n=1 Tax=Acetivibrio clariflavus TaxID=288965 RepID=UPI0002FA54F4|nr:DUF4830 domain-containing protein [Acetivibrio clariflavus]